MNLAFESGQLQNHGIAMSNALDRFGGRGRFVALPFVLQLNGFDLADEAVGVGL